MLSFPVARLLGGVTLASALMAGPVFAQDQAVSREAIDIQNQIATLHQKLDRMLGQDGGMAPPLSNPAPAVSPSAADRSGASADGLLPRLLERVSALEEENRQLRGEVDQLSNQVQQNQASLAKQIGDLQFAMQNGTKPSAASSANAAPSAAPARTVGSFLQRGRSALKAGQYAEAEQNARSALRAAHGASDKLEAQFLLAQSLAGQKSYRQSAVAYYDAYNKGPKSDRAQDSLLGVAASLLALGNKSAACEALGKLKTEFPTMSPRVRSAEKVFRARAACH